MGDTYTVRDLIAALESQAKKSSRGLDTPVYLDVADSQYDIDVATFDDDQMEVPGIYLEAGEEVEE